MFNFKCKYCLLIAICFASNFIKAQSFTITTANTSFNINSTAGLESNTTISSSFSFQINSRNRDYTLYAAVTAKSYNPASAIFNNIPFSISLNNISGVSTTGAVNGSQQLVEYPPGSITLANNATRTGNTATAIWTYDLTLLPIGYTIPPGNYLFTITVQYSDGVNTINRTFNITVTVQSIINLQLSQNFTPSLNFTLPTHFTNGLILNNVNSFTVKSNKGWIFSSSSNTTNFSNSGVSSSLMPASILKLKVGSVEGALSTTAFQLNSGVASSGSNFNMSMSANPGYNYGPGVYSISILYTVTQQ